MAEWAEPCEWCARSNRVLRENLIAKTARKASHADSQKVCRLTRLRVLCVREKQTRARRVEQTGKEHTHWRAARPCVWKLLGVLLGCSQGHVGAVGAGSGERP